MSHYNYLQLYPICNLFCYSRESEVSVLYSCSTWDCHIGACALCLIEHGLKYQKEIA